jgi:D-3-phosphoglycerate dehydrogenase
MRVALLDDYLGVAPKLADWSRVKARADVVVFDRHLGSVDEAAAALADFDILCTLRERMAIPAELIARLPKLKYIVVTGKRYDTIDVEAAARRGVPVSNTVTTGFGGRGPGAVVELTWGLILSLTRNLPREHASMVAGGWQTSIGTPVSGKTLGIAGLGNLGRGVARIGQAFGMDVVAWSPHLTEERARAGGARLVSKQELFAVSDVVSLHLVLGESTRGIVGEAELGAMKPSAYIVNTSRGPLIDEAALMKVLAEKRIAGAGLDVFWTEPLQPDHPIRTLPNVVLAPHLGYFTEDSIARFYRDAAERIGDFLEGKPVPFVNMQELTRS